MAVALNKIFGHVSLKRIIFLLVFLVVSIFLIGTTTREFTSSFQIGIFNASFVGIDSVSIPIKSGKCEGPLRVYMYDLPRKFNLGMLKQIGNRDLPWSDKKIPRWPSNSGLRGQHSVEYWVMVYFLGSRKRKEEEPVAVRVSDPAQADVFFVPFFSSLSFNIHGVNMLDPETEKDRTLQVELVDFLRNSIWWQRSGGQDHVIAMHHPNALRFVRQDLNASMFIVADFGRFDQSIARLSKDIVAPYAHVVDTYVDDNVTDPFETRKTLLYFRGTVRRKDDGIVRIKLAKLLRNQSNVIYEESEARHGGIVKAADGMRQSRFCLHPAGDTPSSCRLFDAIVSHCVPVIVSDKLELPFEDELNYEEFCLFFSVKEALKPGYMIKTLENFPKVKWLKMWSKLKMVAHHYEYKNPATKDDAVNMLLKQVQRKLPAVRLAINRSKRLKIPDWWHW